MKAQISGGGFSAEKMGSRFVSFVIFLDIFHQESATSGYRSSSVQAFEVLHFTIAASRAIMKIIICDATQRMHHVINWYASM